MKKKASPVRSPRRVVVACRLDAETADALTAAAATRGTDRATLLSYAVAAVLRVSTADPPRSRRRRAAADPAAVAVLGPLVGRVGVLAGATVQLARTLREQGAARLHTETERALADLRRAAEDLAAAALAVRG